MWYTAAYISLKSPEKLTVVIGYIMLKLCLNLKRLMRLSALLTDCLRLFLHNKFKERCRNVVASLKVFKCASMALNYLLKHFVWFLRFQTAASFAETLFDIDDSTYDVDDSNALEPVIRTKHQAVAARGHTHVELIDVKCDAKAGMLVTVEFEELFSGIIYSQGYYSDPKCR